MFYFIVRFYFFQCGATSLLKIELQAFRVASSFFRVDGEIYQLEAYFDNPVIWDKLTFNQQQMDLGCIDQGEKLSVTFFSIKILHKS